MTPYAPSLLALGIFGGMSLLQLVIADVFAITSKHTPGTAVSGGHMVASYLDQRLLRSAAFGVATTTLFVLLGVGM